VYVYWTLRLRFLMISVSENASLAMEWTLRVMLKMWSRNDYKKEKKIVKLGDTVCRS